MTDCKHSYSKAMNQSFPRLCIHCGEPEAPYVSDDFQIGPDGAFEYIEEVTWQQIFEEYAEFSLVNSKLFPEWVAENFKPPVRI